MPQLGQPAAALVVVAQRLFVGAAVLEQLGQFAPARFERGFEVGGGAFGRAAESAFFLAEQQRLRAQRIFAPLQFFAARAQPGDLLFGKHGRLP